MIKKILKIFNRRQYLTDEQRKLVESDLKKELDDFEKKTNNEYEKYRRKNREVRLLREILEESNNYYTESEINSLFQHIKKEVQNY